MTDAAGGTDNGVRMDNGDRDGQRGQEWTTGTGTDNGDVPPVTGHSQSLQSQNQYLANQIVEIAHLQGA